MGYRHTPQSINLEWSGRKYYNKQMCWNLKKENVMNMFASDWPRRREDYFWGLRGRKKKKTCPASSSEWIPRFMQLMSLSQLERKDISGESSMVWSPLIPGEKLSWTQPRQLSDSFQTQPSFSLKFIIVFNWASWPQKTSPLPRSNADIKMRYQLRNIVVIGHGPKYKKE